MWLCEFSVSQRQVAVLDDLCFDSLWPLLAFMLEDSIFLNKMTAAQWLAFHFSSWPKVENHICAPSLWTWQLDRFFHLCLELWAAKQIYSTDSAWKDLGLCQQGAKTHPEIFSVAAKSAVVHGASCFPMTSLTISPGNVFSSRSCGGKTHSLTSHSPLCLDTASEGVGIFFGQLFWRNWDGFWDQD